jgi:hypothetical protein
LRIIVNYQDMLTTSFLHRLEPRSTISAISKSY